MGRQAKVALTGPSIEILAIFTAQFYVPLPPRGIVTPIWLLLYLAGLGKPPVSLRFGNICSLIPCQAPLAAMEHLSPDLHPLFSPCWAFRHGRGHGIQWHPLLPSLGPFLPPSCFPSTQFHPFPPSPFLPTWQPSHQLVVTWHYSNESSWH